MARVVELALSAFIAACMACASSAEPYFSRFGEFDPDWTLYTVSGVDEVAASVSNAIPDVSEFVTKAVTNGLASQDWVLDEEYVTEAVTNGLASEGWVLDREYVTETVTNGLASQNWVLDKEYVTEAVTNGLASEGWVLGKEYVTEAVTNGLISADSANALTNGLASEGWVLDKEYVTGSVTNGLASEGWVQGLGHVTEAVTNGLASQEWVQGLGYVTESITNELASEEWVLSLGYAMDDITNDLAEVAFTGSYNSLSDTPEYFDFGGLSATNPVAYGQMELVSITTPGSWEIFAVQSGWYFRPGNSTYRIDLCPQSGGYGDSDIGDGTNVLLASRYWVGRWLSSNGYIRKTDLASVLRGHMVSTNGLETLEDTKALLRNLVTALEDLAGTAD